LDRFFLCTACISTIWLKAVLNALLLVLFVMLTK
jgi:hypothetical protein